ncbi:hypothetical protein FRB96_006319 [Tulasnella sp. 330]|nr:hypothetical protein FRB96_006319 [Tulasnella sp. 330]
MLSFGVARLQFAGISRPTKPARRGLSSSLHFYRNKQLELWASKSPTPLSLRQLVFYGRSMNPERLIASGNYVRTELPTRISHRIRDMQALPYVVVTQEMVAKVYEDLPPKLYWQSFENLEDNEKFCDFVRGQLKQHSTVIPNLALGLSLASAHLPADELDAFFRRMLVSRISRRVLSEHHIALTDTMAGRHPDGTSGHVGIIYNDINVKATIDKCIDLLKERDRDESDDPEFYAISEDRWPIFELDGDLDTKVSYIREHLEYIMFEILKNAMRFSTVHHAHSSSRPIIRTTIVSGPEHILIRVSDQGGGVTPDINSTTDLFSFSHLRNATRLASDRISALRTATSRQGGMTGTVAEQLARRARILVAAGETIPLAVATEPVIQRIGLGLPLSYIFATYFGGTLDVVSLEGWGIDLYQLIGQYDYKQVCHRCVQRDNGMPPKTRNASKKKPEVAHVAELSSAGTQAKLFPLFYKRVDVPTPLEERGASGRATSIVDALQALDDVSSPPPSAAAATYALKQKPDTSKLHSIFTLPVPKLETKASTSSLKSAKPARKAAGKTTKAVVPFFKSTSTTSLDDTNVNGSSTSYAKRKPEVVHLSSVDEVTAMISPSNAPIIICSSPPAKEALDDAFVPSKPVHTFFAPRKTKTAVTAPHIVIDEDDLVVESQAASTWIEVSDPSGSSLHKAASPVPVLKPARRKKTVPLFLEPPWPSAETQHVRGAQESFMSSTTDLLSSRRSPSPSSTTFGDTSLLQLLQSLSRCTSNAMKSTFMAQTETSFYSPEECHRIPAFRAVIRSSERSGAEPIRESWTDHFRPRRANQVLGNEAHAQYLKAWLRTLELGTETVVSTVPASSQGLPTVPSTQMKNAKGSRGAEMKRPIVMRKVEKVRPKKRRKVGGYGADDWIASNESDPPSDEGGYDEQESVPLRFRPSTSPCKSVHLEFDDSRRSSSPEDQRFSLGHFSPLTNSVLLVGPSGSGKTAAVYACAEELEWEVYEVYPGMGKRSGANLSAIVDGVSKNHVIGGLGAMPHTPASQEPQKPQDTQLSKLKHGDAKLKPKILQNFFTQSKHPAKQTSQQVASDPSVGSVDEPIVLDEPVRADDDPLAAWVSSRDDMFLADELVPTQNDKVEPAVRQSLILLEEVDILFAEDKNFWPAVVELIAASRRPIVMTCNDSSLLPLHDLPLQNTLYFESPPKPVMSSYLRSLAQANGRTISKAIAESIVDGSVYKPLSADLPDQPVHPLPTQETPRPDLRQAINQLQFASSGKWEHFSDHVASAILPDGEGWTDSRDGLCDWTRHVDIGDTVAVKDRQSEEMAALWEFMEAVSVVDAHIDQRPVAALDAFSVDQYDPSPNDEVGYKQLPKIDYAAEFSDPGCGVAFYIKDNKIAMACIRLARGCLMDQALGTRPRGETCSNLSSIRFFDSTRVYQARADHQRRLVEFIDDVVQTTEVPLLPRPAMLLDYVPHIQWMVAIDDAQEEIAKAALGSSEGSIIGLGRRGLVRHSSRIGARVPATHERYISLTAEGLAAARGSRLVG